MIGATRFGNDGMKNDSKKRGKMGSYQKRLNRNCLGCRADNNIYEDKGKQTCELGYELELIRSDTHITIMKPVGKCPKPRTWKAFKEEKDKKK